MPASRSALFAALLFFTALPSWAGGLCVYDQASATSNLPGGNTWIEKITVSQSGSVGSMQIHLSNTSAGDKVYVGVYSDDGGAPSAPSLVLASSLETAVVDGWNDIAFQAPVSLSTGTDYWVALALSSASALHGATFNGSATVVSTGSYAALGDNPSTSNSGTTDSFAVRLGDCAVDSPTATPTETETDLTTPASSETSTPTSSPTASVSATPTWTNTVLAGASPTSTYSATASSTRSATPSASPSATPSQTPTRTASPTQSASPSATASATLTATPSATPSPSATATQTPHCYAYTLAGTGSASSSGDNGPATSAGVNVPTGLALDNQGRVLVSESGGHGLRRFALAGSITRVAGTGSPGAGASGLQALASALSRPAGVAVDGSNAIYFAESGNARVRRVDPISGIVSLVAGTGVSSTAGLTSTAAAATLPLAIPYGLAIAPNGDLYISDQGSHSIRKVSPSGVMSTVVGTGSAGSAGSAYGVSLSAASAELNTPGLLAVDLQGRLLIADTGNHAIRRLEGGVLSTLVGDGTPGFTTATVGVASAQLSSPTALTVDGSGAIFISEAGSHSVRKLSGGQLSLVAGTGLAGASLEGVLGTLSPLDSPAGLAVSGNGDLIVAEQGNHRVRRLNSCGVVPYLRPSLPNCYYGVSLATLAQRAPRSEGPAPSFDSLLAPNPATSGQELRVCFNTPLAGLHYKVYDLVGSLVAEGSLEGGSCAAFKAPKAPGIYFVAAEARDPWGGQARRQLKLAVVR